MFKELRRKNEQLSLIESMEILHKGTYGVLSTIGQNGYPYSTPLNYVYYQNHIYFHSALEGHKIENIIFNEKVSFSVGADIEILAEDFDTKYQSVIIFGNAEIVDGKEKEEAMLSLIKKYSGKYLDQGKKLIASSLDKMKVIKIKIEHMSGKKH